MIHGGKFYQQSLIQLLKQVYNLCLFRISMLNEIATTDPSAFVTSSSTLTSSNSSDDESSEEEPKKTIQRIFNHAWTKIVIPEEKLQFNEDLTVQETNVQLKRNIAIRIRNSL